MIIWSMIVNFLGSIHLCMLYDLKCPHSSQWHFRGSQYCSTANQDYYCLLDENNNINVEFCRNGSEIQRLGYKFVIRGSVDGAICNSSKFQPFKFSTSGYSECVFIKSSCKEEGQVISANGSSSIDSSCRCDYTKGYVFVTKPKHQCYCNPKEEDCSCYFHPCSHGNHLTPDYKCLSVSDWTGNFKCKEIEIHGIFDLNEDVKTNKMLENNQFRPVKDSEDMKIATSISIAVSIVLILVGILVVLIMNICIKIIQIYKRLPEYEKMNEKIEELDANQKHFVKGKNFTVEPAFFRDSIKDEYNETIPKCDKKLQLKYVQKWTEDDKRFTKTNASVNAQKRMKAENCILLVGPFGEGKSSIVQHLALEFLQEGYEILPNILTPTNIVSYYDPKKRQVFVIDDFCGREKIYKPFVDLWAQEEYISFLEKIIKPTRQVETKLLMACSSKTYDDPLFRSLAFYENFKCILPELTDEERILIMQKYIPSEVKGNIQDFQYKGIRFPLLCKLASGRPTDQLKMFFRKPFEIIIQDFKNMRQQRNMEFCVITLLTLCNNRFKEEWLDPNTSYQNNKQRIKEIFDEFDLDLYMTTTLKIAFSSLEKTYISKTGGMYNFSHHKISDIAAIVCGQAFFNIFVQYAGSVFISDKYKLEWDVKNKEDDEYIRIGQGNVKVYFRRLLNDLRSGETHSFLHNRQLNSEVYRKSFIKFCLENSSEITDLLKKIKENPAIHDNKNNISININTSYERNMFYKDLQKRDYSFTNIKSPLIESVIEGYVDIVELLLKLHCDVNETHSYGMSALHIACVLGSANIVQLLIEKSADKNICDHENRSPLYIACQEGHAAVAELLLENKSDVALCDQNGRTPLHAAAVNFHLSTAKHLLENKSDPNVMDNSGRTPLFFAAASDDTQLVKTLFQYRAEISIKDKDGWTPLFEACKHGHISTVELLLKKKCQVLDMDNDNRSPLFIASSYGHSPIVDILIRNGADISICDKNEKSSLNVACEGGHIDTINLILQHFPETIEKADRNGICPLHIACIHGKTNIVSSLLNHGANVDSADILGRTPLYISCEKGRKEIIEILFEYNAEINKPDKDGVSPLQVTCRLGYSNITELLLRHKADVFHCNKWGRSSLNLACRKGHYDSVKLLLNAGATINEQDSHKGSPLYTACEEGHAKLVKLLLDKNADISLCDEHGKSPLHAAVLGGHEDTVKELLTRSSILISHNDEFGKTALDYAEQKNYDNIAGILKLHLND